jgi:hypothetical protein
MPVRLEGASSRRWGLNGKFAAALGSRVGKGEKMKKFWRGFRKVSYRDENRMRVRAEQLEKLKRIIHEGRHEAEPEYVEAVKEWKPDISKEELQERIRQFHAAVSAVQERDRESR